MSLGQIAKGVRLIGRGSRNAVRDVVQTAGRNFRRVNTAPRAGYENIGQTVSATTRRVAKRAGTELPEGTKVRLVAAHRPGGGADSLYKGFNRQTVHAVTPDGQRLNYVRTAPSNPATKYLFRSKGFTHAGKAADGSRYVRRTGGLSDFVPHGVSLNYRNLGLTGLGALGTAAGVGYLRNRDANSDLTQEVIQEPTGLSFIDGGDSAGYVEEDYIGVGEAPEVVIVEEPLESPQYIETPVSGSAASVEAVYPEDTFEDIVVMPASSVLGSEDVVNPLDYLTPIEAELQQLDPIPIQLDPIPIVEVRQEDFQSPAESYIDLDEMRKRSVRRQFGDIYGADIREVLQDPEFLELVDRYLQERQNRRSRPSSRSTVAIPTRQKGGKLIPRRF